MPKYDKDLERKYPKFANDKCHVPHYNIENPSLDLWTDFLSCK